MTLELKMFPDEYGLSSVAPYALSKVRKISSSSKARLVDITIDDTRSFLISRFDYIKDIDTGEYFVRNGEWIKDLDKDYT